jgi:tRNA (cytidine/uridine-2'-O-)-methyltransferase
LDYHEYAQVRRHADWATFLSHEKPDATRMFALTTKGERFVQETQFKAGDWFVFGAETRGLAPELRESFEPANRLKLPMLEGQRSLNLSNSVAVVVYEAWRQNDFKS